jgi:hypothetical protein
VKGRECNTETFGLSAAFHAESVRTLGGLIVASELGCR